jgi:hypothetical protein
MTRIILSEIETKKNHMYTLCDVRLSHLHLLSMVSDARHSNLYVLSMNRDVECVTRKQIHAYYFFLFLIKTISPGAWPN